MGIDDRLTSKEWHVQDYLPIGIFVLPPIFVRQAVEIMREQVIVDVELDLPSVIAAFPDQRIFTASDLSEAQRRLRSSLLVLQARKFCDLAQSPKIAKARRNNELERNASPSKSILL